MAVRYANIICIVIARPFVYLNAPHNLIVMAAFQYIMTLKSQFIIALLAAFCSDHLTAQAIAGSWTGFLTTPGSNVDYQVLIMPDLTGYSMTSFNINGRQNSGIKLIRVHQKTNTYILSDGELVFSDYSSPTRRVKLIAMLMLRSGPDADTLTGKFVTKSLDYRSNGANEFSGTVTLYRHTRFDSTKLVAKLIELHLYGGAPPSLVIQPGTDSTTIAAAEVDIKRTVVKSSQISTRADGTTTANFRSDLFRGNLNTGEIGRFEPAARPRTEKTEILRTIHFMQTAMVLTLYDNGIVDGDTVERCAE